MRQKRAKTYRKLMSLYSLSFGFRQPYQVLVDSEMCRWAVAAKIDLQQQLSVVLQGNVKPMITQCCIHELYLQGMSQQAAIDLAKSFERRKCNHREAILGEECLVDVIGKFLSSIRCMCLDISTGDSNKHRYVIATQLQTLRVKLRLVPAVPIIHINRAVMILEPPSDITLEVKQRNEEKAFQPSATELAAINASTPVKPPRKKGPKEPNPLSMKRKAQPRARRPVSASDEIVGQKRRSNEAEDDTAVSTRKRKRRRKNVDSTS